MRLRPATTRGNCLLSLDIAKQFNAKITTGKKSNQSEIKQNILDVDNEYFIFSLKKNSVEWRPRSVFLPVPAYKTPKRQLVGRNPLPGQFILNYTTRSWNAVNSMCRSCIRHPNTTTRAIAICAFAVYFKKLTWSGANESFH